MKKSAFLGTSVAAVLLVSFAAAAGGLKSGPQPGDTPEPFNPLHVTGKGAGGKNCPV
jgi:hypothetical protein